MGRNFEKRKQSIFKTAAQKSKLYSKYSKQLYMAAKNGVPDPEANPALRSIVEKAKRDNVPSHVIEKAIQKAAGTGGEDFQSARYEGFGPGGSLVIVDCLTDNNQRTISEVRSCFTKTGSKLAATWIRRDVVRSRGRYSPSRVTTRSKCSRPCSLRTSPSKRSKARMATLRSSPLPPSSTKPKRPCSNAFPGVELEIQEITFLPQASKTLSAEDLALFEKFLDMLNDCDDVQEIYHNVALPS